MRIERLAKKQDLKYLLTAMLFLLYSCSNKKDYVQIDVNVFYVVIDLFNTSETPKCNILINIPIENDIVYDSNKELILCFDETNGKLTHPYVVDCIKNQKGYYVKARIIGSFKPKLLSLAPEFSPIDIPQNLSTRVKYAKGRTASLTIIVKPNRKRYLEFVEISELKFKAEEPVRIK